MNGLPIYLFTDEKFVDELWMMLKGEGLKVEHVKQVSQKVAGKAKLGLGKIFSWLALDMTGEAGAEFERTKTERHEFTSFFRSLLIREILPSVVQIRGSSASENLNLLAKNDFIDMTCSDVEIVALPTYAGFIRQLSLHELGRLHEGQEFSSDHSMEKMIAYSEKYTASDRAFDFVQRIDSEGKKSHIMAIWEASEPIIKNALSMSNNNHLMIAGRIVDSAQDDLVFCVVREESFRRNLSAYTGSSHVSIFGQVATLDNTGDGNRLIGVLPVSMLLE